MAVLTSKPTSPGRRHVVRVSSEGLHKGAPYRPLLETQTRNGGRNNNGRITTRHIGGGHKQHYRVIDFKRIKEGDAIYFVANYSAAQRGILLFKIDIQAAPGAMVHSLSFQQEFFPDDQ